MSKSKEMISVTTICKLIEESAIKSPVTTFGHGYNSALKDLSQNLDNMVQLSRHLQKTKRKKRRARSA